MPIAEWQLLRAGIRRPSDSSPLLAAWAELLDQRLDASPGQPYLLRPDGSLDDDVIRYCNSESFRRLALRSQIGYAYDLRAYLSFMELHGVDWRVATGEDLVDYEYWRRQDPGNPQPISAATFTRELAAIRRFYVWQFSQGTVESLAILNDRVPLPDGTIGRAARLRPQPERSSKKRWLTPRQYRRWRDVGLRGLWSGQPAGQLMARVQRPSQSGVRGHPLVERSQIERGRGVAELGGACGVPRQLVQSWTYRHGLPDWRRPGLLAFRRGPEGDRRLPDQRAGRSREQGAAAGAATTISGASRWCRRAWCHRTS